MRHLLLLSCLCPALAAQDANPNRFVPAQSVFVARVGAPAKWKTTFEGTQIAKLFSASTLAPMLQQAEMGMQALLEEIRSSGKFDADLLEKFWSDYRGDIVIAVQFDPKNIAEAMATEEMPPLSIVVSYGPAGDFDLAGMAAAIEKMVEDDATGHLPMRDLQIGDLRLRITDDDEMQVSVPKFIDGHMVMLMGTDLETQAAGLIAQDGRYGVNPSGSVLDVHGTVGPIISALVNAASEQASMAGAPFEVATLMDEIGITALEAIDLRVGADGGQLVTDFEIALNGKTAGLFDMVMLDQGAPKLLRYLPPSAEHFSVYAFDIAPIYRIVRNVWTAFEDMAPMSFGDFEAMAAQELQVRLKEDLFDHVGTEMMGISDIGAALDAAAAGDPDDPMASLAGTCFGLSLRDGKAFGAALEKALRARGMHAARKTEDYQGAKVHRLRIAGLVEVEYCITDDLMLVAVGSDETSRRNLRAVLDQRASGEAFAFAPNIKASIDAMPKGWSGVQVTPIADVLTALQAGLKQARSMPGAPPELEMVLGVLSGLSSDLRRLGLGHMVGTTNTSKRGMTSHLRW